MSVPLTGVNPTAYRGVTALTPANTFVHDRDPTIKDWQLYNLGDYWLNKVTYSLWYLANKGNTPPVGNPGVGTWIPLGGFSFANKYVADAGFAVPAAHILNVFGGSQANPGRNINTSAIGNTVYVALNNAIILGDLANIIAENPAVQINSGSINFTNGAQRQRVVWPSGNVRMMADGGSTYFLDARSPIASTLIGYGNGAGTGTSSNNTCLGYMCMTALDDGGGNTVGGANAGMAIIHGNQNTAWGNQALIACDGSSNTAIGSTALNQLTTGNNNIAIGLQSGTNYTGSESNNILINNDGVLGESGVTRIGTAGEQVKCWIAGIVGVTTDVNDAIPVLIDSTGQLGTVSSSLRYKENVNDMGVYSERIKQLRPVTFEYIHFKGKGAQVPGLIAEEVARVFPELVVYKDEQPETVKYQDLAVLLLNEYQKLEKRITDIENYLRLLHG